MNDLLQDPQNTVYVMSGRRPEELDRLFVRVPNLGLIAENGCFLKDSGSNSWVVMADSERIRSWKDSVKGIMTYYLERTPGAEIEERRCSLIFHYKSADDYDSASRQASDCASHINDACEEQRVHAIPMDGCIVVEPVDWTKCTAAEKIFADLKSHLGPDEEHRDPVDFLMVVGDGREDEKVFKWANSLHDEKLVQEVATVSLGNRNTEAKATLTQGVSGMFPCSSPVLSVVTDIFNHYRCPLYTFEACSSVLIVFPLTWSYIPSRVHGLPLDLFSSHFTPLIPYSLTRLLKLPFLFSPFFPYLSRPEHAY